VISPDELNAHLRTFIDPPLAAAGHPYPFRLRCRFDDKDGLVVADQLRAVGRDRLIKFLGIMADHTLIEVPSGLQTMFAV
jgi:mRNA interferase MazF